MILIVLLLSTVASGIELSSIKSGRWVGIDFTDEIYEGYSWTIGKNIFWAEEKLPNSSSDIVVVIDKPLINIVKVSFVIDKDELFYGLGERFNNVVLNNNTHHCWVEDGSWRFRKYKLPFSQTSYFPVPFVLSSKGYGVHLNTTYRSEWTFGETLDIVIYTTKFNIKIIDGKTPRDSLSRFTEDKRSKVPPKFQFGPWNQFDQEFSNKSRFEAIEEFIRLDIPYSVFIDPVHFFPSESDLSIHDVIRDNNEILAKKYGLYAVSYFNSMLETTSKDYSSCTNLFLRTNKNDVYTFYYKGATKLFNASLLDFSNPLAVAYFQKRFQVAVDLGYSGWMYDYAEYVSPNVLSYDSISGYELHNLYPVIYDKVAYDFFVKNDSSIFAPENTFYIRSGYTDSPRYTWNHWTGDASSNWDVESGLPAQIKAQLSIGLSGVPFSGSDIGGFVWVKPPSVELWARWTQLGCFSGTMHMQTGGTSLIGIDKTKMLDFELGRQVWRKYAKLRSLLFPYIYSVAYQSYFTGLPIMRHHILTFPSDRVAISQEYQYMFGPNLLVAPVVSENTTSVNVYLPENYTWYQLLLTPNFDLINTSFIKGGNYVLTRAEIDEIPIYIQSGSIVPTVTPNFTTFRKVDNLVSLDDVLDVLYLWIFPDENGSAKSFDLYDNSYFAVTNFTFTMTCHCTVIGQIVYPNQYNLLGIETSFENGITKFKYSS